MEPSSAAKGFFQELPTLPNQFYDDVSFQRILKCGYLSRPPYSNFYHAVVTLIFSCFASQGENVVRKAS
jgi:hypothetical protein